MSLRAEFLAFDDRLVSHGVKPLTGWWRDGVGGWLDAYERGRVLEFVACCGRGAAKSTALYKLALFFTLFGDFVVPPGERHYAIVLSLRKEEAAKGLAIISRWLTLLGVPHNPTGEVVDLALQPRGIRVVAASVAGTSGWRAYFVGKDERSKWPASGIEAVDAEEIDTSAAAMTATHALAPMVTVGSAWGAFGAFYDAATNGTTDERVVVGPAATWIAAPHITRADCEKKEKNPTRFAREYECIFQASHLAAFDPADIEAAFAERKLYPISAPAVIMDPSSGKQDDWSICLAQWCKPIVDERDVYLWDDGWNARGEVVPRARRVVDANGAPVLNPAYHAQTEPVLSFTKIYGWGPADAQAYGAERIVRAIASNAFNSGTRLVISDQREEFMLSSAFYRCNIRFIAHPWSAQSKVDAMAHATRLFREKRIAIEPHEKMRAQLLAFQEKIAPSGAVTYGARGAGHDDYPALILTACMADAAGELVGSPVVGQRRGVRELGAGDMVSSV